MGTVGEHRGFPVEALSVSHCAQWLASCSHDQLVKFADVREVLTQRVDGHRRLRRADQRRALSSRLAAERDFFGDLDPDRGGSSRAQDPQRGGSSRAEDRESGSEEERSCDGEYDQAADTDDNDHVTRDDQSTTAADGDSDAEEHDGSEVDSDSGHSHDDSSDH